MREGETTVASKRGKRSGTKTSTQRGKAAPAKPAARAWPRRKPGAARARRVAAPARREITLPPLLEQAVALRDAIQRSKLTAADPWSYTAKARGWLTRAEQLLDRIGGNTETAAARKGVETLRAEVEGDREFRQARRLF